MSFMFESLDVYQFTIARSSAHECVPLLEVARRRGLVDAGKHNSRRHVPEVIAKMTSGLIGGIGKRRV